MPGDGLAHEPSAAGGNCRNRVYTVFVKTLPGVKEMVKFWLQVLGLLDLGGGGTTFRGGMVGLGGTGEVGLQVKLPFAEMQ